MRGSFKASTISSTWYCSPFLTNMGEHDTYARTHVHKKQTLRKRLFSVSATAASLRCRIARVNLWDTHTIAYLMAVRRQPEPSLKSLTCEKGTSTIK